MKRKIKKYPRVHMYVASQLMFDMMDSIKKAKIPLTTGDIMKCLMSNSKFRSHGKSAKLLVDRIVKKNGLWIYSMTSKQELDSLNAAHTWMERELGIKILIYKANKATYDPENRARFALPGRVALYLELRECKK